MTIAVICPDGLSVLLFCKGIIAALRAAGWARVLVITEAGAYRAEIEALGVECRDVPISRFVDPLRDICYVLRLWKLLREEECASVLNFSTKPNIYGAIAARLAGVGRVVSHVVGLGSTFLPGKSMRSHLLQILMRCLYGLSCKLSDQVWFTNRNDRDYFVHTGLIDERRTILTRNYLDTSYYAPDAESVADIERLRRELHIESGHVVVLMVARLIRPKGVLEFAEAARLLRERCPECRFLLVAPPEPPSPHTISGESVRAFEADRNFRWLGFRRDMRRLYALCDIAVLPTYYREGGYPRALLEPMSMGKPLVTTTSHDCRETVDHGQNGFLVPPRDATALAEAIATLAGDPPLREALGRNSRRKALLEFQEDLIVKMAIRQAGLMDTT